MALKEHPNEWGDLPKDQVMEWLDHPCTTFMRKAIAKGVAEYDVLAVELVNSPFKFTDLELRSKSEQIRVGKLALGQALELLGKAEEYVKA
jgi:hypothetical protein